MRDLAQKANLLKTEGRLLALHIAPRFDYLPLEAQRADEPLLPYARLIRRGAAKYLGIAAFDLAAYATFGASGMVALERSIRLFSEDCLTILDGPFSNLTFETLLDETAFGSDVITVFGPEWTNVLSNPRLLPTESTGLRAVESETLNLAGVRFSLAGSRLLVSARSLDFTTSLATAVDRFVAETAAR